MFYMSYLYPICTYFMFKNKNQTLRRFSRVYKLIVLKILKIKQPIDFIL